MSEAEGRVQTPDPKITEWARQEPPEPGRVSSGWEPSEWQARFLPETTRWVLREDDPRMGLAAGDVLLCMGYWLDPGSKLTVVARESDGYNPSCNVYRSQVERVSDV